MSASSSTGKAHACNNCPRSFVTYCALTQHANDTGHGFPCAVSGCRKIFGSSAALSTHSSSLAHAAVAKTVHQNTKPGGSVRESSKANVKVRSDKRSSALADQTTGTASLFTCTVPGCQRTFQSKQAREQHLTSAAHKNHTKKMPKDQTTSADAKFPSTSKGISAQLEADNLKSAMLLEEAKSPNPTGMTKTKPRDTVVDDSNLHGVHSDPPHCLTASSARGKKDHMPVTSGASMARPNTATALSVEAALPDPRWTRIATTKYVSATEGVLSVSRTMSSSSKMSGSYPIKDLVTAPTNNTKAFKRCVIAIDCEMVRIHSTTSELARLSAIDYLTGEILVDTLVRPLHAVTDWRTQWSGITAQAMNAAVASGTALKGSPAARAELFKHMDATSILVGHALHHDLAALGIRHEHTVDSAVLAKEAVGRGVKREWGLKLLCKELLNIDVQNKGKAGHDSVEDAFAAREVVLWCLRNPKELEAWGKRKKENILKEEQAKRARQSAKRTTKASRCVDHDHYHDSDESEFLYLSLKELNELCHYPEEYDNWSD